MKKTIIFIRHGESLGQTARARGLSRKDSSLLDADLSPKGQRQAKDLKIKSTNINNTTISL